MNPIDRYYELERERGLLQSSVERSRKEIESTMREQCIAKRGHELCVIVNEKLLQNFNEYYCMFVNRIVECFFGNRYVFNFKYNIRKDGLLEITPELLCGDEVIEDITSAVGGGLVDVISFALRLASILLSRAPKSMWLDEPFKHLSSDLQPLAVDLIRSLANDFDLDFCIVTHSESLKGL